MQVLAGHFVLGLIRKKNYFRNNPFWLRTAPAVGATEPKRRVHQRVLVPEFAATNNFKLWAVSTRVAQRTKDKRHRDPRGKGKNDRIKFGRTWNASLT